MITNEHLTDITNAFTKDVLYEIWEQYARLGRKPSEAVCEALARVYGKTSGEIEKEFEAFAETLA